MALFDPVHLACGERIQTTAPLPITLRRDADLPAESSTSATELKYRKDYKTEKIDVPRASFREVSHVDSLHAQKREMSNSLEKFTVKSAGEYDKLLEYDIDDEDLQWLTIENERRRARGEKNLGEDQFEIVFDRMEKEAQFHSQRCSEPSTASASIHCEGDDVCCVCMDGEVSNVNQIIYCDMCNIAVHQDCYGVPYIPEGQWLCRKCKLSPSEPVHCELCVLQSGAFKPTSDGKWAHVMCAIWLSEVHFGNVAFLEPIEGVANSLRRRCKLRCLVCKVKGGACLQCSRGSCVRSFHVTCAAQAGLEMVAKTDANQEVKRLVYCHMHGESSVQDKEFELKKKKAIDAIRRARRNVVANRGLAPSVSIPQLSSEARTRIEELVGEDIEEIMTFWYYKRRKRSGVPLIRRLQARAQASRRTTHHMETSSELMAMQKGRAAVERARLLCELVKKRERDKNDHLELSHELICSIFRPIGEIIQDALRNISLFDEFKVFAQPVVIDGYSDIIKHPMDLSTIAKKNDRDEYDNIKDLKADLDIMFRNCSVFNKDNPYYLNYGKKMKKRTDIELAKVSAYIQELESDEMLSEVLRINFYDGKEEVNEFKGDDTAKRKRKTIGNTEERKDSRQESTPPLNLPKKIKMEEGQLENTISVTPAIPPSRRSSLATRHLKPPLFPPPSPNRRPVIRSATMSCIPTNISVYRENGSVLSPEITAFSSCDSSAESDRETPFPRVFTRSSIDTKTLLSDPHNLQHGDLVKVDSGSRKVAGQIVDKTMIAFEDPVALKAFPPERCHNGALNGNECYVRLFPNNDIHRIERSAIYPLDIHSDLCDGIEEARKRHSQVLLSK